MTLRGAAVAAAWLASASAFSASPGVPAIGNTPGAYTAYAETNLPAWFRSAVMEAADNTPDDNTLVGDARGDARAELGRVLFYDKRLSHNDGTACASCHTQETGFSDSTQFSEGFEGGLTGRQSPGLSNGRYYRRGRFFWDERAGSLEAQTLGPIEDPVEMGSDLDDLVLELGATEFYPVLFERAFGDSAITSERMSQAMAQFVRAMVSYQSEYDQAIAAGSVANPDFAAVDSIDNPAMVDEGHGVFEANCSGCHGTVAQIATRAENIGLDETDTDTGTIDARGRFKVPSLRNVAAQGRYMHDGRFATLQEVMEFYANGVQDNPNLSNAPQPGPDGVPGTADDVTLEPGGMDLDNDGDGDETDEIAALVAFMEALTDDAFLNEELFSNPFVTLDGDYNGDGVVDTDDLAVWQADYASPEPAFGAFYADGNGDGVVDTLDYILWRENLGARWDDGLSLTGVAVPEPGGLTLLGLLAAGVFVRRRRQRS